jgi:hypothetical protein
MDEASARQFLILNIDLVVHSLLESVSHAEELAPDPDRAYFYSRAVRALETLKEANQRRAKLNALDFPPAAAVIENGKQRLAARAEFLSALSDFTFVASYVAKREIAAEEDLARSLPQGSP